MNRPPNPFVVIVDKSGDSCEVVSRNASSTAVASLVDHANRVRPWSSPHAAWIWNGALWYPYILP
jgi:hypothetical protein